jgi:hypothetical protein
LTRISCLPLTRTCSRAGRRRAHDPCPRLWRTKPKAGPGTGKRGEERKPAVEMVSGLNLR